jgi:hypothetical protein
MVHDTKEAAATQDRVAYFVDLLQRIRTTARSDEYDLVTGSYRAEVERMMCEANEPPVRPRIDGISPGVVE